MLANLVTEGIAKWGLFATNGAERSRILRRIWIVACTLIAVPLQGQFADLRLRNLSTAVFDSQTPRVGLFDFDLISLAGEAQYDFRYCKEGGGCGYRWEVSACAAVRVWRNVDACLGGRWTGYDTEQRWHKEGETLVAGLSWTWDDYRRLRYRYKGNSSEVGNEIAGEHEFQFVLAWRRHPRLHYAFTVRETWWRQNGLYGEDVSGALDAGWRF